MDFKIPDFDLGPIPDNPSFDLDLLNNFPLDYETDLTSTELNSNVDVQRCLKQICAQLDRIEAGMATSNQVHNMGASIELGIQQLNAAIERVYGVIDLLASGLKNYTRTLIETFVAVGRDGASAVE